MRDGGRVMAVVAAVTIGRFVKPQGRKGELLVEPLSDQPERFDSPRAVLVETPGGGFERIGVASCWPHKGRFVLKLDGVDSIDAAERLRGRLIGIAEDELRSEEHTSELQSLRHLVCR